jgi:nucleotide-binding universal stress UspA family protein
VSFNNLKHIACVVDFNEESRMALSVAGTMARASSAELYAIHAIERLAAFSNLMLSVQPTYHTVFYDYANNESYRKALWDMMSTALPQCLSVTPHIVYGSRVQNIVDILQKCRADICIIGIRNKTEWWKHLFSLPVTRRIIDLAPCPVLALNCYSLHGE